MNKNISNQWLHLFLGLFCIFVGTTTLLNIKPDPLRDTVRVILEIVPFVIMTFFGLLLSIKSIKLLSKKGVSHKENDTLSTATEVFGTLTLIGIYIFIIPIITIMVIFLLTF